MRAHARTLSLSSFFIKQKTEQMFPYSCLFCNISSTFGPARLIIVGHGSRQETVSCPGVFFIREVAGKNERHPRKRKSASTKRGLLTKRFSAKQGLKHGCVKVHPLQLWWIFCVTTSCVVFKGRHLVPPFPCRMACACSR